RITRPSPVTPVRPEPRTPRIRTVPDRSGTTTPRRTSSRYRTAEPAPRAIGGPVGGSRSTPSTCDPRLRDLYQRRDRTSTLSPDDARRRNDIVRRNLADRYQGRLPGSDAAPRSAEPRVTPRTSPVPRTDAKGAPPTVRPNRAGDRYRIPGRRPTPSIKKIADRAPSAGSGPRLKRREEPAGPSVRPNVRPRVVSDRITDGPRLHTGGRTGGHGPKRRLLDSGSPYVVSHWNRYGSYGYAPARRFLNGCYHWSAHYSTLLGCTPRWSTWGCYSWPYYYGVTWANYWWRCHHSFTLHWRSHSPAHVHVSWWWPSRCYVPGTWYGFRG